MEIRTKKLIKANYQQVLFVFLAFFTMVLVSYIYISYIVQQQMQMIGEETMNTTQTAVSSSLSESELLFANMARDINILLEDGQSNEDILKYLRSTNKYLGDSDGFMPEFLKVYADIRGEFLDGSGWIPPGDYVPSQRPWHIGAVENGKDIFFTAPYLDSDTGGMCISFSQQMMDPDGNSYGVVAIDLKLSRIIDYIKNQEISNNGYGILIDDSMYFTAHRDDSLITTQMEQAGGDYNKLAGMLKEQLPISAVRFKDTDGTDSIAFFRTIFTGWHIGIIIPRASYFKPVYQLGFVLGLLGSALMLILSYMLVHIRTAKMRSDEESQSKSSFLARMSHEMRTPMNAIIGMTNIAQKAESMDEVQGCLTKINDSANHLLGVINDVLDMSKISAGKMELSNTDFVFKDMLKQVTTIMDFKFEEKHQNFSLHIDENVPAVLVTDRQRLAQVITNLLSNANKFTPEGGDIGLSISKTEDMEEQCTIRIEVEDNGIGISEEQKLRLFNAFEQADNSTSRKYGGTGLGLSISKVIVEMMGGRIWIDSKEGAGTKFIFTVRTGIGCAKEKENNDKDITDTDDVTALFAGKHILLAEDVEINRVILLKLLEDTDVMIDYAENGKEACEKYAANFGDYDMIFMDVNMPEMDGLEATRTIREMEDAKAKTIPIVAMTASVFREDIEKCKEAGMTDHIGKPLDVNVIIGKMKYYLLS